MTVKKAAILSEGLTLFAGGVGNLRSNVE